MAASDIAIIAVILVAVAGLGFALWRGTRSSTALPAEEPAPSTEDSVRPVETVVEVANPMPDINERILPPDKEAVLLNAIKELFPHGRIGTDDWQPIVAAELQSRLYWFKYRYTPWMKSVLPLDGARVLEIGAGTGCSTIPLLESGATVTSLDISQVDLKIAKLRAELHGVADRVTFHCMNAADIGGMFEKSAFDLIVYFASLEHMTTQAESDRHQG